MSARLGAITFSRSREPHLPRSCAPRAEEPMLLVQQVTHPRRIHLDIESGRSGSRGAQARGAGAKRIEFVEAWWVMEAPTGQRFCVVNPSAADRQDGQRVARSRMTPSGEATHLGKTRHPLARRQPTDRTGPGTLGKASVCLVPSGWRVLNPASKVEQFDRSTTTMLMRSRESA